MKKLLLALLILPLAAHGQTGAINGYCNLGGAHAVTSGLSSSNFQQGIIPKCTVTVYLTGTTTLATITSGPASNPFTANTDGSWLFFVAANQGYDIVMSGGVAPNTYPSPKALTDVFPSSQFIAPGVITLQTNGVNNSDQTYQDLDSGNGTVVTNTAGGHVRIDATTSLEPQVVPPITGQYVVVYPTTGTITSDPLATGVIGPSSGTLAWFCSNGIGLCTINVPAAQAHWTGFTLPSYVSPSSVTAVYVDAVSNGSQIAFNPLPGGGANTTQFSCSGTGASLFPTGNPPSAPWAMQEVSHSTTLTGSTLSSATCSITLGVSNLTTSGIQVNVAAVRLLVYYTGTAPPTDINLKIAPPLSYIPVLNTLGVDTTGIVTAAAVDSVGALTNSTSGNAGTATALAATPSLCSTGNAPTGVLSNGNATGCAPIGGGGGVSQIIAGTNVNISPAGGTGVVTINSTGGGSGGSAQVVYLSQSCSGTPIDPTIGLTAIGGAGTDYGTCINGLITTAAGAPIKIVADESVKSSNIHIPVAGNVDIEGLGAGIANTPITNCSVTSNVATLTAKNNLKAGQNVLFSGLSTCSFMNVASGEKTPFFAVSATGLSSTSFQVAVTHANVSGSESGFATFMYGTWLFAADGTNNDLLNVAPNGTLRTEGPNTTPPGRGANVIIRNLGLNGNRGNGSDGNSTTGDPRGNLSVSWYMGIHIWDMEDVLIDGVVIYNAPSFALAVDNSGHVRVINSAVHAFLPGQATTATNQDGFHINGYVNDLYLANDYLRTGDDAVALNSPEGYCGPITRVTANNMTFNQVRQFGRAYTLSANCSSGVSPIINYVAFNNWVGSAVGADAFGFGFTTPGALANSIDHFTWANSRLSSPTGFTQTDTIGSLTFDNVKLVDLTNGGFFNYALGFGTVTANNLTFTNDAIVRTAAGHSVTGLIAPYSGVSGAQIGITNLNIRGFKLEDEGGSWGAMPWLLNGFNSTISNLTYDYDTTNITALQQSFTITTTSTLKLPNINVASCTGCGSAPSWASITPAGTVTTQATFPGGLLFLGGVDAQTGTTYTVAAADENKTLTLSNAASIAVTLPAATTSGFTAGAVFNIANIGAGTATITPTTSTINGASSLVLASSQSARITSDGTNYIAELGAAAAGVTGTSPIVVTGNNVACPTCSVGSGTNVTVNGGAALGTAALNPTTPAAPAGNTNVTWQQSGNNVTAYVPSGTTNITSQLTPTNCTYSSGLCTTTGSVATVTLAGIPGTYKNLRIVVVGTTAAATAPSCQFNGDTATNYAFMGLQNSNGANTTLQGNTTAAPNCGILGTLTGEFTLDIPGYAGAATKAWTYIGGAFGSTANSTNNFNHQMSGAWNSTAAITQVKFTTTSTFNTGVTFMVIGEN